MHDNLHVCQCCLPSFNHHSSSWMNIYFNQNSPNQILCKKYVLSTVILTIPVHSSNVMYLQYGIQCRTILGMGIYLTLVPADCYSLLASSLDIVGFILLVSTSILACSIPGTTYMSIVTAARSIGLGLECSLWSRVLHVVQVTLGALSECFLGVESIESHLFSTPLEMDDVSRAYLY
jgi:hypothetical protein